MLCTPHDVRAALVAAAGLEGLAADAEVGSDSEEGSSAAEVSSPPVVLTNSHPPLSVHVFDSLRPEPRPDGALHVCLSAKGHQNWVTSWEPYDKDHLMT